MTDLFNYSICKQINKSNFEKLMPSGCWTQIYNPKVKLLGWSMVPVRSSLIDLTLRKDLRIIVSFRSSPAPSPSNKRRFRIISSSTVLVILNSILFYSVVTWKRIQSSYQNREILLFWAEIQTELFRHKKNPLKFSWDSSRQDTG